MQFAALAAADLGLKRPVGMKLKAAVKVLLTKRGLRQARPHATVLERRNADPSPGHGSVPDHVRRSTRPARFVGRRAFQARSDATQRWQPTRTQPTTWEGDGALGWIPCCRSVVSLDPLPQ
jgi:hypothetical protein